MAVELPQFDSLAQGLGYANVPAPTTDAADIGNSNSTIPDPGNPAQPDSPTQAMSLKTTKSDAPNLAQTWNSGDKGTNWMGNPSYPTTDTSTESVA